MTKKVEVLTYDEFINSVKYYIKKKEHLDLIKKSYLYAAEKHFGVKRLTGEDYINHPLNVAYILTDINADYITLCAALLHDTVEDCGVTKNELEELFGAEVAFLVDGVTKINKLNFSGDSEAVIANHRKIIVGLCEDVRVIFIKLADRLHNLRSLWILPDKKQKEKAKETLDILTPIAHRLGINHYKSEMEDLSLRYYKPDVYFSIVEQLNQTKAERDSNVIEMQQRVSELLTKNKIKHKIKGRSKSIYSIYKKLNKGKKFSEIYDLLALRVYVNTEAECYQALGLIHSVYKPLSKRFKDYVAMPKTNMYQSLHTTVFGVGEHLYEIQIRTYKMDEIAENGIASHWSYKEHGSQVCANVQNDMEQKLQFFKSIIELKNEESTDDLFVNAVKEEVFKHTIYVYTPAGDVIELPRGSTPIDFAYRIHSNVGDTMVGAIVNESIVPLDYELKDYDIIKINTNKNSTPSREWLNIAKTTQAKNKIRGYFNKIDKEEYLKLGQEILIKELKKRKITINEFLNSDNINKILIDLKYKNTDELYTMLGSNKLTPNQVINIIYNESDTKEEIILKKTQNREVVLPKISNDIIVEGISDIKFNIASCCKPVKGDRIVGYITKGYGITVHRMVCPNVSNLTSRIIDVNWNMDVNKKYPTSILVKTSTLNNILLEIIAKTSNSDIIVSSVNTISSEDKNTYDITILVENKERLFKFINDVSTIQNVTSVERIIR